MILEGMTKVRVRRAIVARIGVISEALGDKTYYSPSGNLMGKCRLVVTGAERAMEADRADLRQYLNELVD